AERAKSTWYPAILPQRASFVAKPAGAPRAASALSTGAPRPVYAWPTSARRSTSVAGVGVIVAAPAAELVAATARQASVSVIHRDTPAIVTPLVRLVASGRTEAPAYSLRNSKLCSEPSFSGVVAGTLLPSRSKRVPATRRERMKHRSASILSVAILALVGVVATQTASAGARTKQQGAAGRVVFVQTNEPAGNRILVYDVGRGGQLGPAGSYATGGNGGIASPGT